MGKPWRRSSNARLAKVAEEMRSSANTSPSPRSCSASLRERRRRPSTPEQAVRLPWVMPKQVGDVKYRSPVR